jgi:hypothetical protein
MCLRTWEEAGTVNMKMKTTPKIQDRLVQCLMVGHVNDSVEDVYREWDSITTKVHETHFIIWLKRTYFQKRLNSAEIIAGAEQSEIPSALSADSTKENETSDQEHEISSNDESHLLTESKI